MKKIILFIIVLFIGETLYSQTDNFRTMNMITDSVKTYITTIEKTNQEIVSIQIDNISKTTDREAFRALNKIWNYKIIVLGDWRVKSIAIEVYKILPDGSTLYVTGQIGESNIASVEFKPDDNGYYSFIVTGVKFHNDYNSAHYGLILYHE